MLPLMTMMMTIRTPENRTHAVHMRPPLQPCTIHCIVYTTVCIAADTSRVFSDLPQASANQKRTHLQAAANLRSPLIPAIVRC